MSFRAFHCKKIMYASNVDCRLCDQSTPCTENSSQASLRIPTRQTKEDVRVWNRKWRIIYTPPYTPPLQPIDVLLAEVKRRVAHRFKYGRTIKQMRLQILDMVSPEPKNRKAKRKMREELPRVTPDLVKSYIVNNQQQHAKNFSMHMNFWQATFLK